jgi:hypothetical protein
MIWIFLMSFLAKFSSAKEAYSGENSRLVTCPEEPKAWAQPMVEKPMKVPISRTVCLVNIVFMKSRGIENMIRESR